MRNTFLSGFIIACLLLFTTGRKLAAQPNKWGLRFGWNFTQYTVKSEGRQGINAGFFYEAKMSKHFLLGTGFEFNSFGATGPRGGVLYKDHLHYLSVPLRLQYFPASNGKLSFDAGLLSGYLIGKSVGNIAGAHVGAAAVSTLETGFSGGLTVYIVKDIRIAMHYYRGLTDISLSPSYRFYTKGLQITAGLNF